MSIISNKNEQITKEMLKYEEETGKKAIWHGSVTESFKRWQKGITIYGIEKKGIGVLVDNETKERWDAFAKENKWKTVSKMIREAVNTYININSHEIPFKDVSKLIHELKQPLTVIQATAELIQSDEDILSYRPSLNTKIDRILKQCILINNKIKDISEDEALDIVESSCDVLIVEDDSSTIEVLKEFFDEYGKISIGAPNGLKALEDIKKYMPKVILLDIILPDMEGYDLCKTIKGDKKLKHIKVYYITAVPESEVQHNLAETGADGYFTKPFKLSRFQPILDII